MKSNSTRMGRRSRTRMVVLATIALTVAGGCASTDPIWFIATPGYVDSRIAVSEEAVRAEYESEIVRLEQELEAQRQVADELAGLAAIIEEVDQSNRELRTLATAVEQRLETLPSETVQLIVDVLQRYLDEESEP